MKKIVLISLIAVTVSGCSNSCDNAKANVAKYLNQYMNSIYKGNIGASAPGGAEALEALEIAKKACNRPDLTVEEILNPEIAKLKAQGQQIQQQSALGGSGVSSHSKDLNGGGEWRIALATFGASPQAKDRTIELSKELNVLKIVNTRPAEASKGYFIVISDSSYSSEKVALDEALQLEQKFSKAGIRLDVIPMKNSEIKN